MSKKDLSPLRESCGNTGNKLARRSISKEGSGGIIPATLRALTMGAVGHARVNHLRFRDLARFAYLDAQSPRLERGGRTFSDTRSNISTKHLRHVSRYGEDGAPGLMSVLRGKADTH